MDKLWWENEYEAQIATDWLCLTEEKSIWNRPNISHCGTMQFYRHSKAIGYWKNDVDVHVYKVIDQLQQQFHLCRRDVRKQMIPRAQNS